jgi:hypothetical protein
MARLNKFLRLPFCEKILFIKAWTLLGIIRLGLSLLPFIALKNLLRVIGPSIARADEQLSEDQLVWAVSTASRFIPKATCLAQALALQLFLQRTGHQARLHIGVEEAEKGALQAHAWVESEGRILIGGLDINRYTHLLALE